MKKIGIVSVLCILAAGLWATGCGSSSSSCTIKAGGITECETLTSGDASAFSTACSAAGGTTGACASSGALGTCSITAGGIGESVTYYSGGGVTASAAQTACTSGGGKWTKA
jgi:hypothetical protein